MSLGKTVAPCDLLLNIKRDSSKWMKEHRPDFAWQDGYFGFSIGESGVDGLRAYIAGQKDNQRSANSAKDTVARFRSANSCMDSSKPYTAVMQCKSTDSGGPQVDPGCNIYDGCSVPTIWCSHNDPSYSGTVRLAR